MYEFQVGENVAVCDYLSYKLNHTDKKYWISMYVNPSNTVEVSIERYDVSEKYEPRTKYVKAKGTVADLNAAQQFVRDNLHKCDEVEKVIEYYTQNKDESYKARYHQWIESIQSGKQEELFVKFPSVCFKDKKFTPIGYVAALAQKEGQSVRQFLGIEGDESRDEVSFILRDVLDVEPDKAIPLIEKHIKANWTS